MSEYLKKFRDEGHVIRQYNINVRAGATLLFIRHLQAQLRTFARFSRGVHHDVHYDECWLVHDTSNLGVPFWFGCDLQKDKPVTVIWAAVSATGRMGDESRGRPPVENELAQTRSRLAEAIKKAAGYANAGKLWDFDVAFRIEGHQILYVGKPTLFDANCVVTLPRRTPEEVARATIEFANNPAIGWLFSAKGTDAQDATRACHDELLKRVFFWSLMSAGYCRSTHLLFCAPTNWRDSVARLRKLRWSDKNAKHFQTYSHWRSVRRLRTVEKAWKAFAAAPTSFLAAVGAYCSAQQGKGASIYPQAPGVVSYMAALESVLPEPAHCDGRVKCDVCGWHRKGHRRENNQQAILRGLSGVIPHKHMPLVSACIHFAYARIRSAYVHRGQTIFQEHRRRPLYGGNLYNDDDFWSTTSYHSLLSNLDEIVLATLWHRLGIKCMPYLYEVAGVEDS